MLVQRIETDGNVNHTVAITVCWIYDSNYKIPFPFIKTFMGIIFYPSKDEKGMYAKYKYFYYTFRRVNPKAKSAKTE